MKNIINITVNGKAGTGKSSLVYLLKEFLKKEGFNTEFIVNHDYSDENDFNKKLEAIKTKTQIYISELQQQKSVLPIGTKVRFEDENLVITGNDEEFINEPAYRCNFDKERLFLISDFSKIIFNEE